MDRFHQILKKRYQPSVKKGNFNHPEDCLFKGPSHDQTGNHLIIFEYPQEVYCPIQPRFPYFERNTQNFYGRTWHMQTY